MADTQPIHVIAEAGSNHCGNLEIAKRLVNLAVKAGADSFKIQIIDPDTLYLPGHYEFGHYDIEKVREIRRQFMMTDAQYRELAEYCNEMGIPFSASIFDSHGLDLLVSMKPPYIKIASTDLNNIRFIRECAQKGLPLILSTGMSSLKDIEKSVKTVLAEGTKDLTLMHCVSVYPATLNMMNLGFLDVLRTEFGFPVALSDHTEGSIAAALSILLGVRYIEKHYTLDKTMEGLDHAHACEGDNFVSYVNDIRSAQAATRLSTVKIGEEERKTRKRARRSLYAAKDIHAGDTVSDSDVLVVRPENFMAADEIDTVVGRIAVVPISRYAPFKPEVLK